MPELRTKLADEELEQLHRDGYLVVHNFFSAEAIDAAAAEVAEQVDRLANALHQRGLLKNVHADAEFSQRLTLIDRDCPGASTILHGRPEMTPAIRRLWADPRVLNMVAQVVGNDIAGHPIWNIRCKTPDTASNNHATVPWHQDLAYLREGESPYQLTAWVPLVDANRTNGCMEVLKGPYFPERRVLEHEGCWRNTWYLTVTEAALATVPNLEKNIVLCEVPRGSALLLDNYVPHRSLPNTSSGIRWSFDLRWQNPAFDTGCAAEAVLMRKADDPSYSVDWAKAGPAKPVDWSPAADLKAVLGGPWMDRWPMTHVNEHVNAWRDGSVNLARHPRKEGEI